MLNFVFMSHEKLTIKLWSKEDRPREKLAEKGAKSLSNAELLTILISTGNGSETALDISKKILNSCENKLNKLSKFRLKDLMSFKGIGMAKAIKIIAALELADRKFNEISLELPTIRNSKDAFNVMRFELEGLNHEQFWLLLLNSANKIIKSVSVSKGGVTSTVVDPKLIFSSVLEHNAPKIILFHNHPSGNLIPSDSDKAITTKLKKGAKILEIELLDHIIIGQNNYFSFADEDLL